jgi:hypothetical protein
MPADVTLAWLENERDRVAVLAASSQPRHEQDS